MLDRSSVFDIARAARDRLQDREVGRSANVSVFYHLLGPAWRGLLLRRGKQGEALDLPTRHPVAFTWTYTRDHPELAKLTAAGRKGQWSPDDLPWSRTVDPHDHESPLVLPGLSALYDLPGFRALPRAVQERQHADFVAWMLSQSLHGEQGALYVACQLTEAVGWTEGKLYGATQVMDEGRHVEVFDRYLQHKLGKRYAIDDHLYVMLDALMSDERWDLKFLGMQILVEGLALGAFGVMRRSTGEPLLRELLSAVITDEARHVHFGVLALQEVVDAGLCEAERREREDWAYEMCVIMRDRFLAHEFYQEHWAHKVPRKAWDQLIADSEFMRRYRVGLFRRVIPNLKRIGLLSDRVRRYYQDMGMLAWEHEKAAPELTAEELV